MGQIEFRSQETFEASEGTQATPEQALSDATFEPSAFVEQAGNFEQSEEIQGNFAALIENAVSEASVASQVTAGSSGGSMGAGGEQVGITPINLPRTADLASSSGGVAGSGSDQVGITPINLPREADLASASGGVAGSGGDQVGITPINLPREADLASSSGGVAGSGAEQVGITPINLPREANVASGEGEGRGGDGVASGEVKGPGGGGVAYGEVKGPGGDGVAYNTVSGLGGEPAAMRASSPVPQPVLNTAESYFKDSGGERVGAMPEPIPHPTSQIARENENAVIDHMVTPLQTPSEILQNFNLQYLMLQNKISQENRRFSMESNILKDDHDTAKNSINNIR